MIYDLVIKGGTILTSTGTVQADIGILGEKVAEISSGLSGREQLSAEQMWVLPGGVDAHVHLEMPTALTETSDTWRTGSKAAALGGTTTLIDFVEPGYSNQPLMEAFEERLKQARRQSAIDFGFHMTLCSADAGTLNQIESVIRAGMPSFKVYTTYTGFHLKDEQLLAVLKAVGQAGGLTIVHAESDAIIQDAVGVLKAAGRQSVRDFPFSRPPVAEQEAIQRVLALAAYASAPVYIVHVSTRAGADAVARSRKNKQAVWGETCPQYLLLDETALSADGFEGAKFVCCPPLRTARDQEALWAALQKNDLQTIGTDHCAFNFAGQKDLGKESFLDIPSGLPGIELRMALLYTYGVKTGRLSPTQWVNLCCTAPARLFGLYPRKGDLQPGSDADIVIFDPRPTERVTHSNLHENVDYTPYEGMELAGKVLTTLLRGQILVKNGTWVEGHPGGNFVAGERFSISPNRMQKRPHSGI